MTSPVLPVNFNPGGNGRFIFTVQDKYYACGGVQGGVISDDCSLYRIGSNELIPVPSATLPRALSFGAAVKIKKNIVWLLGGRAQGVPFTDTSLLFNPATESWSEHGAPRLQEPFAFGCVVPLNDDHTKFLFVGGEPTSAFGYKKAMIYDWNKDSWRRSSDMTVARRSTTNMCFRHTLANGRNVVIVVGGRFGVTGYINQTEIFDIKLETWTLGPVFPHGIDGGIVVQMDQGTFMLGGRVLIGGLGLLTSKVWEMDHISLEWAERPDLELQKAVGRVDGFIYNQNNSN